MESRERKPEVHVHVGCGCWAVVLAVAFVSCAGTIKGCVVETAKAVAEVAK